jgi:hypothetical protein
VRPLGLKSGPAAFDCFDDGTACRQTCKVSWHMTSSSKGRNGQQPPPIRLPSASDPPQTNPDSQLDRMCCVPVGGEACAPETVIVWNLGFGGSSMEGLKAGCFSAALGWG